MVDWSNHHVEQLAGYWFLSLCEVGITEEDEDGFYTCCSDVLEACYVGNVEIYFIIHVCKVRCGDRSASGIEDARV